ncbi:MAG: glutamine--fructose-6-phosphate transaminase (isomerizing) [Chloroflexota bacterium]
MCGIVGYVGPRNAVPILLDGLQRLEYRGYDSAGVAVVNDGDILRRRNAGRLVNLKENVAANPIIGTIGIGHTRWATHGQPEERNSHPHLSMDGRICLVHNGIVENYLELREKLTAQGITFESDTDTEVIVQLIASTISNGANGDVVEATRMAARQLRGANALVVIDREAPDRIVAVRIGNAGGVALGIGEGENLVASDIPAILEHTRRIVFLESREMAVITRDGYAISTLEGDPIDGEIHTIAWDPVSAAKGEYRHFMQKEIFEQARAITDTLRGRIAFEEQSVTLPGLNLTTEKAQAIRRMVITACGTSYFSALVGKFFFEELARIPTEVDYASEYRYRNPIIDENTVLLAITQSGETADTLAAMAEG